MRSASEDSLLVVELPAGSVGVAAVEETPQTLGSPLDHESNAEVLADVRRRLQDYRQYPLRPFAPSRGLRFEGSVLVVELTLPSFHAWQHVPLALDPETLPQGLQIDYRREVVRTERPKLRFD